MPVQSTIVVEIDEVDLAQRTIHVRDKTHGSLKVAFRAMGATVRIPMSGEKWTAVRQGYEWHLERRLDEDSDHNALASLAPGDVRVSSGGDLHLSSAGNVVMNGDILTARKVLRIPHTFTVTGTVSVPVGAVDYIPPMFISIPAGQAATLVGCSYVLSDGTSATVKIQINGADATGLTSMPVTTSPATVEPEGIALATGDMIAPIVTAVSGTPKNLTVTAFVEYETS